MLPPFKKNNHTNVNNYRGITLAGTFSKIFTGILKTRLNTWVENNNVLSISQFGVRKGHSTVDAIFVLNAII